MAKHESRDNQARPDELGSDPGQVGSDSAGQSGDTQGLSQIADAAGEASKNSPIRIKPMRRRQSAG